MVGPLNTHGSQQTTAEPLVRIEDLAVRFGRQ